MHVSEAEEIDGSGTLESPSVCVSIDTRKHIPCPHKNVCLTHSHMKT